MFKKPSSKSRNTVRKREISADNHDDSETHDSNLPEQSSIVRPEKKSRHLLETKSTTTTSTHKLLSQSYASSNTAASLLPRDMNATAVQEIDTATDRDQTAIHTRGIQINLEIEGKEDDKTYRGASGYTQYIKKQDSTLGNATSTKIRVGPMRATSNIRVTNVFDYKPDLCKDYNETGFCGFGDSCKFLHDRGDYKSGWELEKEWSDMMKMKQEAELAGLVENEDCLEDEEEDDDFPHECMICNKEFCNPVVTKCRHFFCESCVLQNFRKSPKCFSCALHTGGIFNVAKDLIGVMEKRKKKAEKLA